MRSTFFIAPASLMLPTALKAAIILLPPSFFPFVKSRVVVVDRGRKLNLSKGGNSLLDHQRKRGKGTETLPPSTPLLCSNTKTIHEKPIKPPCCLPTVAGKITHLFTARGQMFPPKPTAVRFSTMYVWLFLCVRRRRRASFYAHTSTPSFSSSSFLFLFPLYGKQEGTQSVSRPPSTLGGESAATFVRYFSAYVHVRGEKSI